MRKYNLRSTSTPIKASHYLRTPSLSSISETSENENSMAQADFEQAIARLTDAQTNSNRSILDLTAQLQHLNTTPANLKIQPPIFDGTKTLEISDFFTEYERMARFKKLEGENKANAFPLFLKGSASSFYESLNAAHKRDYDRIKQAFMEHYFPNSVQNLERRRLHQIKMTDSETVDQYGNRLIPTARKLNIPAEETLQIYIQGLRTKLRKYVVRAQPATLKDAINAASLYEVSNETYKPDLEVVVRNLEQYLKNI